MRNTIKKLTLAFALAGGVCMAALPAAHAADEAAVKALIAEAETLRQKASELEFEWRWTAQRIKDAKKALAAGKLAEAEKHASRAKREAELAIEQAAKAEIVWRITVPK